MNYVVIPARWSSSRLPGKPLMKIGKKSMIQWVYEFCKKSDLSNFKRPKSYVFIKEIPKSPTGKILRRKILAGEYELDN